MLQIQIVVSKRLSVRKDTLLARRVFSILVCDVKLCSMFIRARNWTVIRWTHCRLHGFRHQGHRSFNARCCMYCAQIPHGCNCSEVSFGSSTRSWVWVWSYTNGLHRLITTNAAKHGSSLHTISYRIWIHTLNTQISPHSFNVILTVPAYQSGTQ